MVMIKAIRLWLLSKKKQKLSMRIQKASSDDEIKDISKQWAMINHQQRRLENRGYDRMCKDVERKNKSRQCNKVR